MHFLLQSRLAQLLHAMAGSPQLRYSCSLCCAAVQGKDALLLYGGEFYDGAKPPRDKTYVYGDLYCYDIAHNRWRKVISPKG